MISQVEALLKDGVQIIASANAYNKKIGVASSNLSPDEKGEVPLSKQGAFTIAAEQATISSNSEAPVSPVETEEVLDLLNTENPSIPVESEIPKEMIEPVKPTVPEASNNTITTESTPSDVIINTPVEVASPTELTEVKTDLSTLIPNIDLESKTDTTLVEPVVDAPVELPEMPSEVVAEAPTDVNNDLFVNQSSIKTETHDVDNSMEVVVPETPFIQESVPVNEAQVVSTPFEEPSSFENSETETQVLENPIIQESVPANESQVVSTQSSEPTSFENFETETQVSGTPIIQESAPVDEPISDTPLMVDSQDSRVPKEETEPLMDNAGLDSISKAKLDAILERLKSIQDAADGLKSFNENVSNKLEKLDGIDSKLGTLNHINENLESINNKLDNRNVKEITPVQDVIESQVQNPVSNIPPLESAPTLSEHEKQEDLVDALSQIPGSDVPSVDDTKIKGMFV